MSIVLFLLLPSVSIGDGMDFVNCLALTLIG